MLSVEETRVTGTIYGDRGSSAAASILLDRNTSDTQNWVEANSDHGLLDAQLKALKWALDWAKEHYRLWKMKIVSYHQDDVVTWWEKWSRSRVSTSIVFRDEETRHTWAINTIEDSAFDSAYEWLLDGIRYAHLVRIWKLQHHQDKTLDDIFWLSTDELILRCWDIVWLSNRRVKELLDLEEPSEEETES